MGRLQTGGEKDAERYNKVHQVFDIDEDSKISFGRESWDFRKEITPQGNRDLMGMIQQSPEFVISKPLGNNNNNLINCNAKYVTNVLCMHIALILTIISWALL